MTERSTLHNPQQDYFKTINREGLPHHMRSIYKYIHPDQLGHENKFVKMRNFKKFNTDIHRSVKDRMKQRGPHPTKALKRPAQAAFFNTAGPSVGMVHPGGRR